MKIIIDPKIKDNYPDLRIGVLIAREINNIGFNEELEQLKQKKLSELQQKYTIDSLRTHPYIQAWRETYRSFGVNPKKKTPTAEAFLTRLLKRNNFPKISKVVDLYLLVETEFFLPIGGYDLDKIVGDIILRYSSGGEKFLAIGSENYEETQKGEIVYSDKEKILTRRWNYKDSEYTKITENSKNIILMSEASSQVIPTEHLLSSFERLKEYISKFCGGTIKTFLIDVKKSLEYIF